MTQYGILFLYEQMGGIIIRKVELTMNEQRKYEVIKKLAETNGNKQRAALNLQLSVRQINRLLKGYQLASVCHKLLWLPCPPYQRRKELP